MIRPFTDLAKPYSFLIKNEEGLIKFLKLLGYKWHSDYGPDKNYMTDYLFVWSDNIIALDINNNSESECYQDWSRYTFSELKEILLKKIGVVADSYKSGSYFVKDGLCIRRDDRIVELLKILNFKTIHNITWELLLTNNYLFIPATYDTDYSFPSVGFCYEETITYEEFLEKLGETKVEHKKESKVINFYWETEKDLQLLLNYCNYNGVSCKHIFDSSSKTLTFNPNRKMWDVNVYCNDDYNNDIEAAKAAGYKHISEYCAADFKLVDNTTKTIGWFTFKLLDCHGVRVTGKQIKGEENVTVDFMCTLQELNRKYGEVELKVGCSLFNQEVINWYNEVTNAEK